MPGLLRAVPRGRGVASCIFTPLWTELHFRDHGGPSGRARTATYEHLIRPDRMNLFDVGAISGAAMAPLIGKRPRLAQRLLFGAFDFRLGVSIPRAALVGKLDEPAHEAKPESHARWLPATSRAGLALRAASWLLAVLLIACSAACGAGLARAMRRGAMTRPVARHCGQQQARRVNDVSQGGYEVATPRSCRASTALPL
jgi:hypothetical protein